MFEEKVKISGALRSKVVVEVNDNKPKRDKKTLARYDIEQNVFDKHDAIADNAKMISLILTVVSRIYDVLPDSEKDNIDSNERALIEYALDKFKITDTRADKLFATEGTALVDKLMDRQADIANILEEKGV